MQRHLAPLTAGFLGVALAVGWTAGEIVSASVDRRGAVVRIVRAAPVVMTVGLAAGALLVRDGMSGGSALLWALSLVLTGTGIGMAWPHLSVWAMTGVDEPAEGPVAAAAISTVQLICGAFGAGIAGAIVNRAGADAAALGRAFERFQMRQRQFAAVLGAHAIPVTFDHCPAGQDPRAVLSA